MTNNSNYQSQPQPPGHYPNYYNPNVPENSLAKNNSNFKFGIIAFCLSISIILFFILAIIFSMITNLSGYPYSDDSNIKGFFLLLANLDIIPSIVFAIIGLTKVNKLKNKKGLMLFFCISALAISVLFIFFELSIAALAIIVTKSIQDFFNWLSNNSDKLAAMG